MRLPKGFEIVETADSPERFMVLYQGFQWGNGPYDPSGCSGETWKTRADAADAINLMIAR